MNRSETKYYVRSGDRRLLIQTTDDQMAAILLCCAAVDGRRADDLGYFVDVNQTGFEDSSDSQFTVSEIMAWVPTRTTDTHFPQEQI